MFDLDERLKEAGVADDQQRRLVANWLERAKERRPVVLVGAGFSKNAKRKATVDCESAQFLDWDELTQRPGNEEVFLPPLLSPDHVVLPKRKHGQVMSPTVYYMRRHTTKKRPGFFNCPPVPI